MARTAQEKFEKQLEKQKADLSDTIGEAQEVKTQRAVDEIRQKILSQQPKEE